MLEKQVKTSKAKSEKKAKEEAGSPLKESSPVPAQSLEGKSFQRQVISNCCSTCRYLAAMRRDAATVYEEETH